MDPLAATLGALTLSSWLISYYISRPARTFTSNGTKLVPSWLLTELEVARIRVASLLPFAVELIASHELTRAGSRALGNSDPGILPLVTLSKALEQQLSILDTNHFKHSLGTSSSIEEISCREEELTAALINFSGVAEVDTLVAKVLNAHPLRLDKHTILNAQRAIADAEIAVYTAATLDDGIDFDKALIAHMAAAGSAPGSNSLAVPVLSRKSTEVAIRASLWIYVVGFAMKTEAEDTSSGGASGGGSYKGFSKEFNQIASEQRNALRELGLSVK